MYVVNECIYVCLFVCLYCNVYYIYINHVFMVMVTQPAVAAAAEKRERQETLMVL